MLTVVTGAAGFVGTALGRRMAECAYPGTVRVIDLRAPCPFGPRFESVAADLTDRAALAAALDGADRVIHLAALPGGAAEADPQASRRINLDLTLDILDLLARAGKPVRFVHASSVAVFGDPLPASVDDETVPQPSTTYGSHKRMAELAVADAVRRGDVEAVSLRLPGIVARPRGAEGFKSVFISDLFWAMRAGERFTIPVGPSATTWMMSARRCADNLLHAAACTLEHDRSELAITLPAIRASMTELVDVLACVCGADDSTISYAPDPELEARFGQLPPLRTAQAETLGFRDDGGLHALVRAGLSAGVPA